MAVNVRATGVLSQRRCNEALEVDAKVIKDVCETGWLIHLIHLVSLVGRLVGRLVGHIVLVHA